MGLAVAHQEMMLGRPHEPAWLGERRREGWDRFLSLPWPTPKDEPWRRTPLADFAWDQMPMDPVPTSAATIPNEVLESGTGAALVTHQDAATCSIELTDEVRRSGIIVADLETAAHLHAALVEPVLARDPGLLTGPLAKLNALNQARWTHGTFIYVPRGVQLTQPVRITHLARGTQGLLAPRTLVVLEPGSVLSLIEETLAESDGGAPFIPSVVELIVQTGAHLEYYHLQNWGSATRHFLTQQARIERDGHLLSLLANLGGRLTKASVEAHLAGAGARSDLFGVAFGVRDQHSEYHTLQHHLTGQTTSDLLYKTALKDRATSLYTGLIRIAKGAGKSDAYQANRNLLLSNEARADSIPMLEILTDDVRCTHGATVGPVDPDQAFYLETRGIQAPEAERMLVEGFFEQVFQRLPLSGLRELLHQHVTHKLQGG